MKSRLFPDVATATIPVGPRVLYIHPTTECALDCTPCYLKRNSCDAEQPLEFFEELIRTAQACDSVREIALSINVDPDGSTRNRDALKRLSAVARTAGYRVSVITNYENIEAWGTGAFSDCQSVTFSVDEYKFPALRIPTHFFKQITQLQSEGCVVNLNLLLGRALLDGLTVPRLRRWLGIVDQIHLLVPKHVALDFSRTDLDVFFDRIAPIWESEERFFHLHVDSCIKPALFPWNLLTSGCEEAANLVNVLPDGGMAQCALDEPLVRIQNPADLVEAIQKYYVDESQAARPTCPEIGFLAS